MVLMRMRNDEAQKPALLVLHEPEIGHDQINARRIRPAEADAEIHHQPFLLLAAKAIGGAVHSDFAKAAQGDKNELFAGCHMLSALKVQGFHAPAPSAGSDGK